MLEEAILITVGIFAMACARAGVFERPGMTFVSFWGGLFMVIYTVLDLFFGT